jgi:SAM-dependent methyltransferase
MNDRLSNLEYLLQRSEPKPGETFYLHLSDLAEALRGIDAPQSGAHMLDFGCGGSPYRGFFPGAHYKTADFGDAPDLDFRIQSDGAIDAHGETFDVVLSTQVLEHIDNVDRYLDQCRLLLRPGGTLILTTHGTFEDHPCPGDFRRWTAEGLRIDLERRGFDVARVCKTTTNARALAFLLQTKGHWLCLSRKSPASWIFWLMRGWINRFPASFDRWCDRYMPNCRVVDIAKPGHTMYIGLFVVAKRRG